MEQDSINTPESAVAQINTDLKFLGLSFTIEDLLKSCRLNLGTAEVDFGSVAMAIHNLSLIARELRLTHREFIHLFGNRLNDLAFGCQIIIDRRDERKFAAIQLDHRNPVQLKLAHAILCSRGVRCDYALPSGQKDGQERYSLGFSCEL